jgi:threonine dehydrogenase-like Zn-dependent dehydrogenase
MRALCYHGIGDIRFDTVPDPKILAPDDLIIKVDACAICGSDLHLMDGVVPTMKSGDVMGHETMGTVVEVGETVAKFAVGDRLVTPFVIACGQCWFCHNGLHALCDRSNPSGEMQKKQIGHATAGLFGYSHMYGGFPGGQAEYLRIPYANVGPIKIPEGVTDSQALFLSDIFPTGWMAAENAAIEQDDTVAVWGCGPVGQFAIRSALLMGAKRVIAVDEVPERLSMARLGGAETIDFSDVESVYDVLMQMTQGRGPDSCIDAVGTEAAAHGSIDAIVDNVKMHTFLGTDRAHVLREVVKCVRKGGHLSIPGVYIGGVDKFMMGAFVAKGLTMIAGQTNVQAYLEPLMKLIQQGKIDPSFVVTHERPLEEGPQLYKTFRDKKDGCIKVMLRPGRHMPRNPPRAVHSSQDSGPILLAQFMRWSRKTSLYARLAR